MSKRVLLLAAAGLVVVAAVVFGVFQKQKGAHLELTGSIIKVRTGSLDATHSAAVLDFRVHNPSDIPFVVNAVEIELVDSQGKRVEGMVVSKRDFEQLLTFNRFLGTQYNPGLGTGDQVKPHEQVDRMAAATFEIPLAGLQKAKSIHLKLQDLDGPVFETTRSSP